jgi:hypothetical protein
MGAEFDCRRFDDADKATVQAKWEAAVDSDSRENGRSYSGTIAMLPGPISWRLEQFATREEAEQFLVEKHQKWEPPMAVRCGEGWIVGGWCSS